MWAVAQGHTAMVKELIASGADVNVRSTVNDWDRQVTGEPRAVYRPAGGLTPLLFAAREGCVDCIDLLVNAGADINYADPEAITPLLMAVMNMQFDTAAQLIRRGANPNKWDLWGRGPLYSSVDVNTLPRGGRPDLPSLDKTTSQQVIGMLLEAGAYTNQQLKMPAPFRNVGNDRGLDPHADHGLHAAAARGQGAGRAGGEAAARKERGHHADQLARRHADDGGVRPRLDRRRHARLLHVSEDVQQRSIETLTLLIAAGGDINAKDNRGLTPLHEAARWGWNDVVTFLVSKGANLDAKDNRGMTPVDSAMGRAGGNSRGGARIDIHADTAELLKKLIASARAQTAPK